MTKRSRGLWLAPCLAKLRHPFEDGFVIIDIPVVYELYVFFVDLAIVAHLTKVEYVSS